MDRELQKKSDLELRQRRVDEEFTALFGAQKLNATTPSAAADLELRRLRVNKEYAALCYLNCNARKFKGFYPAEPEINLSDKDI